MARTESRPGHAVYLDCNSPDIQSIAIPETAKFAILQSGVKHALSDGEYNRRRVECEEAAHALGAHKLREATRAMLEESAAKGRLTGGGFGGAVIALIDAAQTEELTPAAAKSPDKEFVSPSSMLLTGAGGSA